MVDQTRIPTLGQTPIVGTDGRPLTSFQGWVNRAFGKIETSVADLASQLGLITTAQTTADSAQTSANAAQSAADAAQTAADDAAADAATAQADAAIALDALDNLGDDGKLSPVEKKIAMREYDVLIAEQSDIDAKATAYSVTTEKTNYDNALSALTTYLNGLTSPVNWDDITDYTTIVGATWNSTWAAVYDKRQLLLNKIAEVAGTKASWAGVTGSGKPADNATVNIITTSSSAPSSPTNGDIWVDTSVTPNVTKVRVSGSWVLGATIGAKAGDNLYDSAGASLGDSAVKNSAVTLTVAGVLLGAGGGSVAYDSLPDGSTYARIRAADLSGGYHRIGVAGSGYRIGDLRNLPVIGGMGARYKFTGAITYTATAGTPATATISVAAGSSYMGSATINYNAMSVGVSGTGGTSVLYFLYFDDASYAGGSKTLVATSNGNTVYQNDGRSWVGTVEVVFPAAGGGSGGGGYGSGCVAADSWVETQNRGWIRAQDVIKGDMLRVLNDSLDGTEWAPVRSNHVEIQPAWEILSESGITVRCSDTTPLTLRDGSNIMVPELDGQELPVQDGTNFRWEPCWAAPYRMYPVSYISLGGLVYAAGDEEGRAILTHNPYENVAKP